jgi:hypothetical protein
MALKRQTRIHLRHTETVIDHLQERAAGVTNNDLHTGSSRIQAVLYELFRQEAGR